MDYWGISDTETLKFYPFGTKEACFFPKESFLEVRKRLAAYGLEHTELIDPDESIPLYVDVQVDLQVKVTQHKIPKGRKFKT